MSRDQKILDVLKNRIKNIEPNKEKELIDFFNENYLNLNNIKKIEKILRSKLKLNKSYSINSYNYWIYRGWSNEEIEKNRPKKKK